MYNSTLLVADATSENSFSANEVVSMRDQFVSRYCGSKNWDKYNLSVEQVSEIRSHQEWKTPGMIKS